MIRRPQRSTRTDTLFPYTTRFRSLGIELARYCERINDVQSGGGLSSWRLRLIDERLHEGRDAPTLTELAELCKLSVRQLTRGFRASRGCSIGRSEERRVGEECVSTCRSRWSPALEETTNLHIL